MVLLTACQQLAKLIKNYGIIGVKECKKLLKTL